MVSGCQYYYYLIYYQQQHHFQSTTIMHDVIFSISCQEEHQHPDSRRSRGFFACIGCHTTNSAAAVLGGCAGGRLLLRAVRKSCKHQEQDAERKVACCMVAIMSSQRVVSDPHAGEFLLRQQAAATVARGGEDEVAVVVGLQKIVALVLVVVLILGQLFNLQHTALLTQIDVICRQLLHSLLLMWRNNKNQNYVCFCTSQLEYRGKRPISAAQRVTLIFCVPQRCQCNCWPCSYAVYAEYTQILLRMYEVLFSVVKNLSLVACHSCLCSTVPCNTEYKVTPCWY